MIKKWIKPIFALTAVGIALAGCGDGKEIYGDVPQDDLTDRGIVLKVGAPDGGNRAAVDEWDNTLVSIAYVFAPSVWFDRALTVSVADNDGAYINTGMEYPLDYSAVSFIGYHPVAAPNAAGVVTYDISKGDVDVMMSNTVSGTLAAPITDKLVFEHKLTRVVFKLRCAPGQSYPEAVFGIRASSASLTKSLSTAVSLDTEPVAVNFKIPGGVFRGSFDGFVIPLYGLDPVVIDMMLQPGVPLAFNVVSLTGDRDIVVANASDNYWHDLTTVGGEAGKQYTVNLSFSGVLILAQDISVDAWVEGNRNIGGNSGTWW